MADCCSDAHFELAAALDHIAALGFEKESKGNEEIWHNREAERLRERIEALQSALRELMDALEDELTGPPKNVPKSHWAGKWEAARKLLEPTK